MPKGKGKEDIQAPNKVFNHKQPPIEEIAAALEKTKGHITNTAKLLGVTRATIWRWAKEQPDIAELISEKRKETLDNCISVATMVALGIPIRNEKGALEGWQERPDPNMLKYLISTLGRDEGFGESVELEHKVTKGIDISKWIERETSDTEE